MIPVHVHAFVIASLACIAPSPIAAQQQGCGVPSSDAQVASLIAGNYGTAQGSTLPSIVLQTAPEGFKYRFVCLSTSGIRDQYRFVSVVAYYTIDGGEPEYGQYEFECVQSQWSSSSTLLDESQFNRTVLTDSSPAINATLRTDCSYCLAPWPSLPYPTSDAINHCNPCDGCTLPQLCYSQDSNIPPTAECCNVYMANGSCATQCSLSSPPPFTDANRTCVQCLVSCQNDGELQNDTCDCDCSRSVVYGGTDCTACMCINGGSCSGSSCTCPPGYTGVLCETSCLTSCPTGYYLNNCNCVQCKLSCQNGGVLRNDTCGCNCKSSGVYGGTDCTACLCMNGGSCNGSMCACATSYTGQLCGAACSVSCPQGYVLSLYGCSCEKEPACTGPDCNSCGISCVGAVIGSIFGILILIIILVLILIGVHYLLRKKRTHAKYTGGKTDAQLLFADEFEM